MRQDLQLETDRLVKALLTDAAAGARTTVELLRDQAARVTNADRTVLLGLLRGQEHRMDSGGPCGGP